MEKEKEKRKGNGNGKGKDGVNKHKIVENRRRMNNA